MHAGIIELLHGWHEFFITVATAAATLIASMFVVVSIGGGMLTAKNLPQIRAFFTATVVHLANILLYALVALVPSLDQTSFAALLALGGAVGLGFSLYLLPVIRKHGTDIALEDWFWYGGAPVAAYGVVLATAACVLGEWPRSLELLGFGLVLLLLVGIRNAWDLIIYLVTHRHAE